MNAAADFLECVVVGELTTFTLNGKPDIGVIADIEVTETTIATSIDIELFSDDQPAT